MCFVLNGRQLSSCGQLCHFIVYATGGRASFGSPASSEQSLSPELTRSIARSAPLRQVVADSSDSDSPGSGRVRQAAGSTQAVTRRRIAFAGRQQPARVSDAGEAGHAQHSAVMTLMPHHLCMPLLTARWNIVAMTGTTRACMLAVMSTHQS